MPARFLPCLRQRLLPPEQQTYGSPPATARNRPAAVPLWNTSSSAAAGTGAAAGDACASSTRTSFPSYERQSSSHGGGKKWGAAARDVRPVSGREADAGGGSAGVPGGAGDAGEQAAAAAEAAAERREFFGTAAARQRVLERQRRKQRSFYGSRSIGELGSFIYLVNQIFGTSLVAVPYVFKASGVLPCLITNAFMCGVAAFAALMLMRSMTLIKGNDAFQKRVEYAACVSYFLGKRRAGAVQCCFYLAMQAMNIASIVVVSQAIDQLLLLFSGLTAGLQVYPTVRLRFFDSEEYAVYSGTVPVAAAGAASYSSAAAAQAADFGARSASPFSFPTFSSLFSPSGRDLAAGSFPPVAAAPAAAALSTTSLAPPSFSAAAAALGRGREGGQGGAALDLLQLQDSGAAAAAAAPLFLAVTLGYLLCACICIPLSTCSMEENMTVQYSSFAFLLFSIVVLSLSAAFSLVRQLRGKQQHAPTVYNPVRSPAAAATWPTFNASSHFVSSPAMAAEPTGALPFPAAASGSTAAALSSPPPHHAAGGDAPPRAAVLPAAVEAAGDSAAVAAGTLRLSDADVVHLLAAAAARGSPVYTSGFLSRRLSAVAAASPPSLASAAPGPSRSSSSPKQTAAAVAPVESLETRASDAEQQNSSTTAADAPRASLGSVAAGPPVLPNGATRSTRSRSGGSSTTGRSSSGSRISRRRIVEGSGSPVYDGRLAEFAAGLSAATSLPHRDIYSTLVSSELQQQQQQQILLHAPTGDAAAATTRSLPAGTASPVPALLPLLAGAAVLRALRRRGGARASAAAATAGRRRAAAGGAASSPEATATPAAATARRAANTLSSAAPAAATHRAAVATRTRNFLAPGDSSQLGAAATDSSASAAPAPATSRPEGQAVFSCFFPRADGGPSSSCSRRTSSGSNRRREGSPGVRLLTPSQAPRRRLRESSENLPSVSPPVSSFSEMNETQPPSRNSTSSSSGQTPEEAAAAGRSERRKQQEESEEEAKGETTQEEKRLPEKKQQQKRGERQQQQRVVVEGRAEAQATKQRRTKEKKDTEEKEEDEKQGEAEEGQEQQSWRLLWKQQQGGDWPEQQQRKWTQSKFEEPIPSLLGERRFGQLFSTFIASYSYVTVVPCWANEMLPDVRVERSVWLSSSFCCFLYFVFGLLLSAAYPAINSDNILQEMLRDPLLPLIARFAIYVFDLFTVLPGILVYCIATKYNMVNSGFCTKRNAFWFGCVAPFFISWLLMNDAYFSGLLMWSSLFFSLICNFVAPISVYILACKKIPPLQRNLHGGQKAKVLFSPHLRRNIQALQPSQSADQVRLSLLQWLRSTLRENKHSRELDPQLLHLLLSPSAVPFENEAFPLGPAAAVEEAGGAAVPAGGAAARRRLGSGPLAIAADGESHASASAAARAAAETEDLPRYGAVAAASAGLSAAASAATASAAATPADATSPSAVKGKADGGESLLLAQLQQQEEQQLRLITRRKAWLEEEAATAAVAAAALQEREGSALSDKNLLHFGLRAGGRRRGVGELLSLSRSSSSLSRHLSASSRSGETGSSRSRSRVLSGSSRSRKLSGSSRSRSRSLARSSRHASSSSGIRRDLARQGSGGRAEAKTRKEEEEEKERDSSSRGRWPARRGSGSSNYCSGSSQHRSFGSSGRGSGRSRRSGSSCSRSLPSGPSPTGRYFSASASRMTPQQQRAAAGVGSRRARGWEGALKEEGRREEAGAAASASSPSSLISSLSASSLAAPHLSGVCSSGEAGSSSSQRRRRRRRRGSGSDRSSGATAAFGESSLTSGRESRRKRRESSSGRYSSSVVVLPAEEEEAALLRHLRGSSSSRLLEPRRSRVLGHENSLSTGDAGGRLETKKKSVSSISWRNELPADAAADELLSTSSPSPSPAQPRSAMRSTSPLRHQHVQEEEEQQQQQELHYLREARTLVFPRGELPRTREPGRRHSSFASLLRRDAASTGAAEREAAAAARSTSGLGRGPPTAASARAAAVDAAAVEMPLLRVPQQQQKQQQDATGRHRRREAAAAEAGGGRRRADKEATAQREAAAAGESTDMRVSYARPRRSRLSTAGILLRRWLVDGTGDAAPPAQAETAEKKTKQQRQAWEQQEAEEQESEQRSSSFFTSHLQSFFTNRGDLWGGGGDNRSKNNYRSRRSKSSVEGQQEHRWPYASRLALSLSNSARELLLSPSPLPSAARKQQQQKGETGIQLLSSFWRTDKSPSPRRAPGAGGRRAAAAATTGYVDRKQFFSNDFGSSSAAAAAQHRVAWNKYEPLKNHRENEEEGEGEEEEEEGKGSEEDAADVADCVERDVDEDAAAMRAQLQLPQLLLLQADEVERNVWLLQPDQEGEASAGHFSSLPSSSRSSTQRGETAADEAGAQLAAPVATAEAAAEQRSDGRQRAAAVDLLSAAAVGSFEKTGRRDNLPAAADSAEHHTGAGDAAKQQQQPQQPQQQLKRLGGDTSGASAGVEALPHAAVDSAVAFTRKEKEPAEAATAAAGAEARGDASVLRRTQSAAAAPGVYFTAADPAAGTANGAAADFAEAAVRASRGRIQRRATIGLTRSATLLSGGGRRGTLRPGVWGGGCSAAAAPSASPLLAAAAGSGSPWLQPWEDSVETLGIGSRGKQVLLQQQQQWLQQQQQWLQQQQQRLQRAEEHHRQRRHQVQEGGLPQQQGKEEEGGERAAAFFTAAAESLVRSASAAKAPTTAGATPSAMDVCVHPRKAASSASFVLHGEASGLSPGSSFCDAFLTLEGLEAPLLLRQIKERRRAAAAAAGGRGGEAGRGEVAASLEAAVQLLRMSRSCTDISGRGRGGGEERGASSKSLLSHATQQLLESHWTPRAAFAFLQEQRHQEGRSSGNRVAAVADASPSPTRLSARLVRSATTSGARFGAATELQQQQRRGPSPAGVTAKVEIQEEAATATEAGAHSRRSCSRTERSARFIEGSVRSRPTTKEQQHEQQEGTEEEGNEKQVFMRWTSSPAYAFWRSPSYVSGSAAGGGAVGAAAGASALWRLYSRAARSSMSWAGGGIQQQEVGWTTTTTQRQQQQYLRRASLSAISCAAAGPFLEADKATKLVAAAAAARELARRGSSGRIAASWTAQRSGGRDVAATASAAPEGIAVGKDAAAEDAIGTDHMAAAGAAGKPRQLLPLGREDSLSTGTIWRTTTRREDCRAGPTQQQPVRQAKLSRSLTSPSAGHEWQRQQQEQQEEQQEPDREDSSVFFRSCPPMLGYELPQSSADGEPKEAAPVNTAAAAAAYPGSERRSSSAEHLDVLNNIRADLSSCSTASAAAAAGATAGVEKGMRPLLPSVADASARQVHQRAATLSFTPTAAAASASPGTATAGAAAAKTRRGGGRTAAGEMDQPVPNGRQFPPMLVDVQRAGHDAAGSQLLHEHTQKDRALSAASLEGESSNRSDVCSSSSSTYSSSDRPPTRGRTTQQRTTAQEEAALGKGREAVPCLLAGASASPEDAEGAAATGSAATTAVRSARAVEAAAGAAAPAAGPIFRATAVAARSSPSEKEEARTAQLSAAGAGASSSDFYAHPAAAGALAAAPAFQSAAAAVTPSADGAVTSSPACAVTSSAAVAGPHKDEDARLLVDSCSSGTKKGDGVGFVPRSLSHRYSSEALQGSDWQSKKVSLLASDAGAASPSRAASAAADSAVAATSAARGFRPGRGKHSSTSSEEIAAAEGESAEQRPAQPPVHVQRKQRKMATVYMPSPFGSDGSVLPQHQQEDAVATRAAGTAAESAAEQQEEQQEAAAGWRTRSRAMSTAIHPVEQRPEAAARAAAQQQKHVLPTIQVTYAEEPPIAGYEDALAVDEDLLTGDLLPIKIHVYPTAYLRNKHIELSISILTVLLLFAAASLVYQLFYGDE